jgi:HK97 gp10 family phage protein
MIFGKVSDISKLIQKLESTPTAVEKGVNLALKKAALELHREAVSGIREVSGGEIQTRYNPKRSVVVSKPGDAPNSDTGQLIQSIQFELEDGKAFVGSNLGYASDLEFGTKNMAARPWLSLAFMKTSEKIAEIMRTSINDSIQKALGVKGLISDLGKIAKSGNKSGKKIFKKTKSVAKKAKRQGKRFVKSTRKYLR